MNVLDLVRKGPARVSAARRSRRGIGDDLRDRAARLRLREQKAVEQARATSRPPDLAHLRAMAEADRAHMEEV